MRALREFFSEITDIDSRLVKTVIGLFRNPRHVVESSLEGDDTYTKPLRYLLFTSTVFIFWRFVYTHYIHGIFIGGQLTEIEDLNLPERISNAASQFSNLQDTFFPFQILIFVVPLAIILVKLLFPDKSWSEVRDITMYSFGQFWILLMPLVPVLVFFDDNLLLPMLAAFAIIGIFFQKLLAKNILTGLARWMALGFLLIIWFYRVALPIAQWSEIKILLSNRIHTEHESTAPREEVTLPITEGWVDFVIRDPDNRFVNKIEKQEGLLIRCFQPDTALLWETLLPGASNLRRILSVRLPSTERGFLVLANAMLPNVSHAILISAAGKILFTKIYEEEMSLNGGDVVNGSLVLTGGKNFRAEGITPFVDVLELKFNPAKEVFELTNESSHYLKGSGNRFDNVYAINNFKGQMDLIVSKYETANPNVSQSDLEINRISILHVRIDSTLQTLWETEIFKRTSKYWPPFFETRYDPSNRRIVAYYSLADDKSLPTHIFCVDTLGEIKSHQKFGVNELTYITDLYSAQEGIYFCGWTELGIPSPFLGFGRQGLIGFFSDDGKVSTLTVGKDRQAHYLTFYKIFAKNDSLVLYGERLQHFLMRESELELMKFDRALF